MSGERGAGKAAAWSAAPLAARWLLVMIDGEELLGRAGKVKRSS